MFLASRAALTLSDPVFPPASAVLGAQASFSSGWNRQSSSSSRVPLTVARGVESERT
jgi:hypothetical protein